MNEAHYDPWSDEKLLKDVLGKFGDKNRRFSRVRGSASLFIKRLIWRVVIGSTHFFKSLFDIYCAVLAIVLLSPIFVLTWLLIKIEDPGPSIFVQTRVGRHSKTFPMYKFRSMVLNADQLKDQLLQQNESAAGVIFKMKDDPRITRVGKFIRKFSIDELPQLFNVLFGHMSLVGPRPLVPREVAEYSLSDRRRLDVKPGITCLWQIGGRSDIDFEGQVRLDVQYIKEQGFWNDLKILFKTIPAVLLGKGAY
jgi:lipopolysaccharide/colanic/teichoic acid biosynthesis glycosyltransferase